MKNTPLPVRLPAHVVSVLLASVLAPVAYGAYPTGPEIDDKYDPGAFTVTLTDYATAPKTGVGNTTQIARLNFLRSEPVAAPGASSRLFVNDLNGVMYTLDKTTHTFTQYLDLASNYVGKFDATPGFAAGFVTFQFDPGYADSNSPGFGTFYTTHTEIDPNLSSTEYRVGVLTAWKDTNITDNSFTGTHREMLRVTYSDNVHPLGDITFNPNATAGSADYRMMYISSGDGAAGENGNTTIRNQDQMLNNYLGKILRIQPDDPDGAGALTYTIPSDNPYASTPNAKGEIWAYGFRNPHRLYWDAASNKLIVDDIGLHSYEEVNIVQKGANYGYSKIEGNQVLGTNNDVNNNALPATLPIWTNSTSSSVGTITPTYPVAMYSHNDGDAISSGFVYRGTLLPALQGKYIFGDISTGRLFWCDYAQMLAADDGDPLTLADIHELRVLFNGSEVRIFDLVHSTFDLRNDGVADGDTLPGSAANTGNGDLDPYGVAYTGGRADIRLAMDGNGDLYLISKSDGMIRQFTAAVPEPGALGILAAGALFMFRRRR